jgi:Tol biopolymer transport system component
VFDEGIVYKKINQLRKALGDDSQVPRFIETIPKRGYRLVAAIIRVEDELRGATTEAYPATVADPAGRRSPRRRVGGVATVIAVAVVLAAVAGALIAVRAPPPEPVLRITPLFTDRHSPGTFRFASKGTAAWSPDGKAVAYTMRPSRLEEPEVHVRYLDAPVATRLTVKAEGAFVRAWTPAGRILFNTAKGPSWFAESTGLWSVSAAGGEPELVFTFSQRTTNVMSMTRDGATLAVLGTDGDVAGVWVGTVADGKLQWYEPAPFAIPAPSVNNFPSLSFSPDGRQLLLVWNARSRGSPVSQEDGEHAWLLPYPPDAARPPRRAFETLPTFGGTPDVAWMPDNRHVVVSTAERGAPRRLYLADIDTGNFRALPSGPSTGLPLPYAVSPGGDRIILAEVDKNYDVVTLDVGTGAISSLLASPRSEGMPAWAADGSLVYYTERNGPPEIWLRDPTGADRPIATHADFPPGTTRAFMAPQLSPDGSRVMYVRIETNALGGSVGAHLWMSSVAGGAPVRLTKDTVVESAGSWSPDGRWYVYRSGDSLRRALPSSEAEPEILATAGGPATVPVWSPDGRWILYEDFGLRLKLLSLESMETRDLGLKDSVCTFADHGDILYCIRDFHGESFFAVVDFHGQVVGSEMPPLAGKHVPATPLTPSLRLSLTPDGKGVSYGVDVTTEQLLLVEGLDTIPLP